MTLRTPQLLLFALAILAVVYLVFFKEVIIYTYYGYDSSIVGSNTALAYEALQRTFVAHRLSFLVALALTLLSLLASCLGMHRKEYLPFNLTYVIAVASLGLSSFYLFILFVSSFLPHRTF
jgi:hypothetical protein